MYFPAARPDTDAEPTLPLISSVVIGCGGVALRCGVTVIQRARKEVGEPDLRETRGFTIRR